jgi:D-sedoheptulose 7-phosphate isomerase
MDNLESLLRRSNRADEFAGAYLAYLTEILGSLDRRTIATFIDHLEEARRGQKTVFLIGNGGSAATASHMANDLSIGTLEGNGEPPLRAMALTDNMAAVTAIANDRGFEDVFVRQLQVYYGAGDKLVAISASGNSPNVLAAAEWVKKRGGTVIGLVGFDGGKLKAACDVVIHVATPLGEYGPVEDVHMILDHLIFTWMRGSRRMAQRP